MERLHAYPENLSADYIVKNCAGYLSKLKGRSLNIEDDKFQIYEEFLRADANNCDLVWGEGEMIESISFDKIDIDKFTNDFALEPTKLAYLLMMSTIPIEKVLDEKKPLISESKFAIQDLMNKGADKYAVLNLLVKKQRIISYWFDGVGKEALVMPFRKAYKILGIINSPYDKLTEQLKELVLLNQSAQDAYSIDGQHYFYGKAYILEQEIYSYIKDFDPYMLKRVSRSMEEFEVNRQKKKQGYDKDLKHEEDTFIPQQTPTYLASKELERLSTNIINERNKESEMKTK